MALRAVLTNEEFTELDEELRGLYKQDQGKSAWVLELEEVDNHPMVRGLSSTLSKFKEIAPDAKTLKTRMEEAQSTREAHDLLVAAWGELNPEETKTALERLAELEAGNKDVDVPAAVEAAKTTLQKKHDRELQQRGEIIDGLKTDLAERDSFIVDLVIEQELDAGLAHIKAIEELREGAKAYLYRKYGPKVEKIEDENTGKIRYQGVIKVSGVESTLPDFFERWQTEEEAYPYLPPSGNRGTGSKPGETFKGRKTNPWIKEHWNLTEQGRILLENKSLAKQMASAAGTEIKD